MGAGSLWPRAPQALVPKPVSILTLHFSVLGEKSDNLLPVIDTLIPTVSSCKDDSPFNCR